MVWTSLPNRQLDMLIVVLLVIASIALWPLWIVLVIFLISHVLHRWQLRKVLMRDLRHRWLPESGSVLFFTSNSKHWKAYFEKELLPKIETKTRVLNWSTREQDGWSDKAMEARIADLFGDARHSIPFAMVFLPSGDFKMFFFQGAFLRFLKSKKKQYKKLETEFLKLVEAI